jgi:hypothetical protein
MVQIGRPARARSSAVAAPDIVGHECSIGKMSCAIELTHALQDEYGGNEMRKMSLAGMTPALVLLAACQGAPNAVPSASQPSPSKDVQDLAESASQPRKLTGAQIRAAYVGNTGYTAGKFGPKTSIGYFSPDGTLRMRSPDLSDIGTYKISDEGFYCSKWARLRGGVETCLAVYQTGEDTFEGHLPNGTVLKVSIVPGNPEGL